MSTTNSQAHGRDSTPGRSATMTSLGNSVVAIVRGDVLVGSTGVLTGRRVDHDTVAL